MPIWTLKGPILTLSPWFESDEKNWLNGICPTVTPMVPTLLSQSSQAHQGDEGPLLSAGKNSGHGAIEIAQQEICRYPLLMQVIAQEPKEFACSSDSENGFFPNRVGI